MSSDLSKALSVRGTCNHRGKYDGRKYTGEKMPEALDVVKTVYKLFSENDIAGFLELCAEDIEWVVNGPPTLEKCRAFNGRGGVQEFLNILGASWQFSDFAPREYISDGKTVVVLGEETGIAKNSNIPFRNRWAHVFDVKEGKIIRFREFLCHWTGDQQPPAMTWSVA